MASINHGRACRPNQSTERVLSQGSVVRERDEDWQKVSDCSRNRPATSDPAGLTRRTPLGGKEGIMMAWVTWPTRPGLSAPPQLYARLSCRLHEQHERAGGVRAWRGRGGGLLIPAMSLQGGALRVQGSEEEVGGPHSSQARVTVDSLSRGCPRVTRPGWVGEAGVLVCSDH